MEEHEPSQEARAGCCASLTLSDKVLAYWSNSSSCKHRSVRSGTVGTGD